MSAAYARGYVSRPKNQIPSLQSLDKVQLTDLRKIKAFLGKYDASVAALEAHNEHARRENKIRMAGNDRAKLAAAESIKGWERASGYAVLQQRLCEVGKELAGIRKGLLSGLWSETITFEGMRVPIEPGRRLIREHEKICSKLNQLWPSRPSDFANTQPLLAYKKQPSPLTVIKVAGTRLQISALSINSSVLEDRISELEALILGEREQLHGLRARAAVGETETRRLAKRSRVAIDRQLSLVRCCPYCGDTLDPDDVHQDHIHPVCKGGRSAATNLVYVCSPCNRRKSDTTLGMFLRAQGYLLDDVHARLQSLGKDL